MRGFYFITDSGLSNTGIVHDVQEAVGAGVCAVQYRNKSIPTRRMIEEARVLRDICRDIPFIINDRVDVARAVKADGVHVGQDDMPCVDARRLLGSDAILGVTVHSLEEARTAQLEGANYVAVSPIFATHTKKDAGLPVGLELIRHVKAACSLPIVAIGGISFENAGSVIEAGADAVCAISALMTLDDLSQGIQRFNRLFYQPHP